MEVGRPGASDSTPIVLASVAAVVAAVVLSLLGSDAYETILGVGHPIAATLAITALGLVGWRILVGESSVPVRATRPGARLATAIGLVLPVPVIIVDTLGGFGRDINVAWPDSLLFYPSVALVAEFTFHIAPLALAAVISSRLGSGARSRRTIGLGMAVTAEPVLQILWGAEQSPAWANAYVGVHLLAFNAIGVHILRRHGFLQVYLYRLAYYAIWHIAWGYLRMGLLFDA